MFEEQASVLATWLVADRTASTAYRHNYVRENESAREDGLSGLADAVLLAHADAVRRLEELARPTLSPLEPDVGSKASGYPHKLHTLTLQGYLGEILGGVAAEVHELHDLEWRVPAFLFRHHPAAFQALERSRQLGGATKRTPGRTGDDFLAFVRDDAGQVTAWLMGEAKCTPGHTASLIADGYRQLSTPLSLPVDLLQLIEVVEGQPNDDGWSDSLRVLNATNDDAAPPRYDALVYVCGQRPQLKSTWVDPENADDRYTGAGPLEVIEVHLSGLDTIIETVYPGHVITR